MCLGDKSGSVPQVGASIPAPVTFVGKRYPFPWCSAGFPIETQVVTLVVDGTALLGDGVPVAAGPYSNHKFGGRLLESFGQTPGEGQSVGTDRLGDTGDPYLICFNHLGTPEVSLVSGRRDIGVKEPEFNRTFPVIGKRNPAVPPVPQNSRILPYAAVRGHDRSPEKIHDVSDCPSG